jgi:hypothetical protein
MTYTLTFLGKNNTQVVSGLVENIASVANVAASTVAAGGGSALSLTLTAPFSTLVNSLVTATLSSHLVMGPVVSEPNGTAGYTVTFTSGANSGNSFAATYYAQTASIVAVNTGFFLLATVPANQPAINDTYTITGPGITGTATGAYGEDQSGNWYYTFTLSTQPAAWTNGQSGNTGVIDSGSAYGNSYNFYSSALSSGTQIALLQVPRGTSPNSLGSSFTFFAPDQFQQNGYPNSQWYMPPEIPAAVGLYGSWDGVTNFGGWLSFVSAFTTGTDSTGVTGVNWPQYIGLSNGGSTLPLVAQQQTFNGVTFNFLVTQTYDPTMAPLSMFGVEAISTGTISGDLNIIQAFFAMIAQNYNVTNGAVAVADQSVNSGNDNPSADVASYQATGPTVQPFPSNFNTTEASVSASITSTPILGGGLTIVATLASTPAGWTSGYQTCVLVNGGSPGNTITGIFDSTALTFTVTTSLNFNPFQGATLLAPAPTWFTTSISGNALTFTLNSQFPNAMGSIGGNNAPYGPSSGHPGGGSTGPTYPYILMGTAPNMTQTNCDSANYSVYGVENPLNDVLSGASSPGAPAYAFLTGLLYDSAGNLQNQTATTTGTVTSIISGDRNHVYVDNTTKTAMNAAGFTQGINDITLTWLPSTSPVSTAVTVGCANRSQTVYLTAASRHALRTNGVLPSETVQVTVTSGPNIGKTFNTQLMKWFHFQSSLALTRGTTLTITTTNSNYNNLNSGTWSGGRWDGNVITFDNVFLPHNCLPIVLNQNMIISQLIGVSKGNYKVWLYDSTGTAANAIEVTGQLDLSPDRTDVFNPPPIVQLRVDNTYGYDSQTGQQLYPALLSNQQDYNALQVLSSGSTISGLIITLTTADNTAMWAAGFQPYSNTETNRNEHVISDGYGHKVNAIWDGQGTLTLDNTPPSGFTGPFTVKQNVRPDKNRIQLALDPTQYATGYLKIVYSGTIDKTLNCQLITSPAAADAFSWTAPDETLESTPTTSAFDVGLNGHGNATITIPFTITSN